MLPILAESAPHRCRALALAAVLAITSALAAVTVVAAAPHHRRWAPHHRFPHNVQCTYSRVTLLDAR
jgi:hypothetical protein